MPDGFGVRISDDAGSLVKRDRRGLLNTSLSFPVHPSYSFDFDTMAPMAQGLASTSVVSDSLRYAQRPLYYLELWPTSDTVVGQTYEVQFDMTSFAPTDRVYLPLIRR